MKAKKVLVTYLENKLGSLEIEKRLQKKSNEKLMRKYAASKTVVGTSGAKTVKYFATYLVGMAIRTSKAILRYYFKEVSELDYLSEHLRCNWIEHSKQIFQSGTDIEGRKPVAPLHSVLLVEVGI